MNRAALALLTPLVALAAFTATSDAQEERPQRDSPPPDMRQVQPSADERPQRASRPPGVMQAEPDAQPAHQPVQRDTSRVGATVFKADDDVPYRLAPGTLERLKPGAATMRNVQQPMSDLPYFGDDLPPSRRASRPGRSST